MAHGNERQSQAGRDDDSRSDATTSRTPGGSAQVEQEPGRGNRSGRDPSLRSDPEIRDEVSTWLAAQEDIDDSQLDVLVEERIVVVLGTVGDYATKRRIEDFVRNVRGVREVHDQLLVARDSNVGIGP